MKHTTTISSRATEKTTMGNGQRKSVASSASVDQMPTTPKKSTNNHKDVSKWTSTEVQHWVKQQCKKFELKKTTVEKFEMNGQALVLLTKHDFIRRSPDGGEVLYYALQKLINPNKVNNARLDQSVLKSTSSSNQEHPRIVELPYDPTDETNHQNDSSSQPIVEEPDDPPAIRRSQSETHQTNHPHGPSMAHPFFFQHPAHFQRHVVTMPPGMAAAYFQQQQNTFLHPHPHFVHPHVFQQYHPMMSAQGVLIEIMDDRDTTQFPVNGSNFAPQESLYMVTMNGQRYIMNEAQVIQLVNQIYQRQVFENQQQQQRLFTEQQFFRQQQQQQQQ